MSRPPTGFRISTGHSSGPGPKQDSRTLPISCGWTMFCAMERIGPSRLAPGRPFLSTVHRPDPAEAYAAARRAKYEQSGMVLAAPYGRKGEDANQIINAVPKVLDSLCRVSGLLIHVSGHCRRTNPASSPLAEFSQELIRRYKERILLQDAADDHHGMSSHDVNHCVTTKTAEMVGTDNGVVVPKPYVVYTGLELNHVIDMRSIFNRPVHTATNAAQRKSSLGVSAGQLLKYFEHPILIEAAIWKVDFGVGSKLELPALLRDRGIDACAVRRCRWSCRCSGFRT